MDEDVKWPRRGVRGRGDPRLVLLYQATLDEAIPDDMARLAALIGAQQTGD